MDTPEERFTKWMAALRSGDYVQGRKFLAAVRGSGGLRELAYCCMGVGLHVLGATLMELKSRCYPYQIHLQGQLEHETGGDLLGLTPEEEVVLGWLNDKYKLTFPQIAAFIEGADPDLYIELE